MRTIKKMQFSLIEMLVILAIISILVSLLSPSLSRFVRHAREIQCSNDIGKLLNISHLYANDFNGIFPDLGREKNSTSIVQIPFFTFKTWGDTLINDYNVDKEIFYSPSNEHWTSKMHFNIKLWGKKFMVMGRSYYGSSSLSSYYNSTILPSYKGDPTFSYSPLVLASQNVLWTDLNRKLAGTDEFVNPIPGGYKKGSNHINEFSSPWPYLSHNGMIDGSVQSAKHEEIKVRFKNQSSVNHW